MPRKNENVNETANETVIKDVAKNTDEKAVVKEELVYNPEKKVTVKTIASWTTGFKRIESNGDVTIPANGSVRLNASEIIAQIQNGNSLFTGTDEQGAHATLFIDDKATRIEGNLETEDRPQLIITTQSVKDLFKKPKTTFKKALENLVVTRAEKYAIIDIVRNEKLFDDYEKVRTVEDYTGLRI